MRTPRSQALPTRPGPTALPHTALPHTALPHTALPHTALPQTALPHTALPHTALPYEPSYYLDNSEAASLSSTRHTRRCHTRRCPSTACRTYLHALCTARPTPSIILAGYPLSDTICTNLTDDQTAGSDVPFEELGLNNQDIAGKRVAGFSAASGTSPEAVLATTDFVGGHTYIAVWGANGAHSDQPYSVQVETSQPSDVLSVANQDPVPPSRSCSTPAPVSTPVPAPADQAHQTLFVT